jgi:hypothetical protein
MHEWLFTFGVLVLAGLCGVGFLGPFLARNKLVMLAAPMVGILMVTMGANACYSVLMVQYKTGAMLSAAVCLGAGALAWRNFAHWRQILILFCVAAGISALTVWKIDWAAVRYGGPAIFYLDGTDHGGYAQLADWFNDHLVFQFPTNSPTFPYQSFPELLYYRDPRFGSFGLLAIISKLYGASGLFSFDAACAIVMGAACMGVAAVFARRAIWLAPVMLGLFISNLFDYVHCGYFGKLVAYPAALLLAGLVLDSLESPTVEQMFGVAMLASAVGLMHSGEATAVLIGPILAMALLALACRRPGAVTLTRAALLCAMTLALPVVASGVLARPLGTGYPDYQVPWSYVLPRVLDLENQGTTVSGCGPAALRWMILAAGGCWAAALAAAVAWRSVRGFALLMGPAILLAAMAALHDPAGAFQMLGFIYPATLCGAVILLEQIPRWPVRVTVAVLALTMIGLRVPRFLGSQSRYASHAIPAYVFTESEIKRLVAAIGSQSVEVDVSEPHDGVVLLDELGRRNLNVVWSKDGWRMVVGYRPWTWTPPPTRPDLLLRRAPNPQPLHHFELIGVNDGQPRD